MILSFSTKKLRDTCEQLERADRAYGAKQAQALFGLLAEIEAFETAAELQALYADSIIVAEDSLLVTFASQCQARFEAVPQVSGKCVGWSRVRRLKLTQVEVETNA